MILIRILSEAVEIIETFYILQTDDHKLFDSKVQYLYMAFKTNIIRLYLKHFESLLL